MGTVAGGWVDDIRKGKDSVQESAISDDTGGDGE
jgi:hypothetical protein